MDYFKLALRADRQPALQQSVPAQGHLPVRCRSPVTQPSATTYPDQSSTGQLGAAGHPPDQQRALRADQIAKVRATAGGELLAPIVADGVKPASVAR